MSATTLEERVMMQELTQSGMSDRCIAQQMGWSISTVRKWRRQGQRYGHAGLVSRMGRPVKGAMSTFDREFERTLRSWRTAQPGWGPKTLHTELVCDPFYGGKRVPSISTITRWLKQEGFSRPYEKRQDLPEVSVSPAQFCH